MAAGPDGSFFFALQAASQSMTAPGNLQLAGDFSATNDDILGLGFFEGEWKEISRSAN
jgi:hypothetical protein